MLPIYQLIVRILMPALLYMTHSGYAEEKSYPSLWQSHDAALQTSLEQLLDQQQLSQAVAKQQLAIALVDISTLSQPKLAAVNGDRMFYAASLPKIAILLAAFVQIDRGELQLDDALWADLNSMIRTSSNRAASNVLAKVGPDKLIDIISSEQFALYDEDRNGGLWVGKAYAKSPAYQRDPLQNLSHAATAIQAARFYYLLETGQLVSSELTSQMKSVLTDPKISHKFVKGLNLVPELALYRKSGTWRDYHADSVMVDDGQHKYIMVGLAHHAEGGQWLEKLALPLHKLITKSK